ncbi:hypothetical protein K8I61_00910 [bacterium]|nr:hypothetical protein [bacterium]
MPDAPDFFLAGVMQGSTLDAALVSQDYRERVKAIVANKTPGRRVYCPLSGHAGSVDYDNARAATVFRQHIELACRSEFLIAYLPVASMGTAIEVWECRRAGVPVIAISPMAHNWVVRLFSNVVLADLDAFEAWLCEDALQDMKKGTPRNVRAHS